jgi:hypothetical protein
MNSIENTKKLLMCPQLPGVIWIQKVIFWLMINRFPTRKIAVSTNYDPSPALPLKGRENI